MSRDPREANDRLIERARQQAARVRSNSSAAARIDVGAPASISGSRIIEDGQTRYEIHRELHRGGQGVVYLATQCATRRKVAVKFMRGGPLAGPMDRARFEREVRILGSFRHPGIVTIHDSGVSSGAFYYAMDYVDGVPIDRFVEERRLDARRVVAVLAEVADAVATAHLRGVIHRDLKPGNILIDAEGKPHLLDFGLARRLSGEDDTVDMTQTGQFVGSLPWASPEQTEGGRGLLDTRTDVYSIGVLAYRLLTGSFPYPVDGTWREVSERIRSHVPRPPGAVRRGIDADLDTLVLKCLAKEPERRYQTAAELAADFRHYLAGEPIQARRDNALKLLRRNLRRYRTAVGVGILFTLLVTFSAVALGVLYQRQIVERRRAEAQARIARQERDRAEVHAGEARKRFQMARDTAAFMLNQVSQKLLHLAGAAELRRELLQKTYEQLSALTGASSHDPLLQLEIARTHLRLSHVARNDLADAKQANEQLEAAIGIVTGLLADDPRNAEFLALQAGLHAARGQALADSGALHEAMADFEREQAISARLLEATPDDLRALQRMSGSCGRLATLAHQMNDRDGAARWMAESTRIAQRLTELQPENVEFAYYAALGESRLGWFAAVARRDHDAEQHFVRSLQICDATLDRAPNDARFLSAGSFAAQELAGILQRGGRVTEARTILHRKESLNDKLIGLEPQNAVYQSMSAGTHLGLARLGHLSGESAEVATRAGRAVTMLKSLDAAGSEDRVMRGSLAEALGLLGAAELAAGNADSADRYLTEAHELFDALGDGEENLEWVAARAECCLMLSRLADRREDAARASDLREKGLTLLEQGSAAAAKLGDHGALTRFRRMRDP